MKKNTTRTKASGVITLIYIPLTFIFMELVVFFLAGNIFDILNFAGMILVSVASGIVLTLLSSITKRTLLNTWIAFFLIELITFFYMLAYFVQETYQNFTNIETIISGAGGIVKEFGSSIANIIINRWPLILLFEIPALIFILGIIFGFIRYQRTVRKKTVCFLIFFLVFELAGSALFLRSANNRNRLFIEYDYNSTARIFSVQTATKMDIFFLIFGDPNGYKYTGESNSLLMSAPSGAERNVTNIDFDTLIKNEKDPYIRSTHKYISSLTPSDKNDHTGLFAGKNLIFISAEAMSEEMISRELTPALFRLKEEGITLENYYQPYWNGSTATGELSNVTGLIPTKAMGSFEASAQDNLYLTMGNTLMREGYFSRAYHNGTVEYYGREKTHTNFGYEKFIANGNGMEEGLSGRWPESDLEMMEYAIPQFIDKEHFSIYFMSLSGHFPYFHDLSAMVEKYSDQTKDKGYSDFVEAYICSQMEFDRAVEFLIRTLEDNDLADDTVIVIAPDHYPYGLTKNDAFGTDADYLGELFGSYPDNVVERDHNTAIIWSGCLNEDTRADISTVTYSVDILPTLLNLFGKNYDSRLLPGRDVFSSAEGLAIWPDYSWATDKGTYIALTDTFYPADDKEDVDRAYIETMKKIVRDKITFSDNALEHNYYDSLFK